LNFKAKTLHTSNNAKFFLTIITKRQDKSPYTLEKTSLK